VVVTADGIFITYWPASNIRSTNGWEVAIQPLTEYHNLRGGCYNKILKEGRHSGLLCYIIAKSR